MKNKILLFGLAGMLSVSLLSCEKKVEVTTEVTTNVNKDSIKTVIAGMESRYAKGMETKSIDDIMAYYADDVKSYETGSGPVEGAAAMKKMTTDMFAKMPGGMKVRMEPGDMMIASDGSLVSETGSYSATDSLGNKLMSGYFLATFEIRDGQYKCVKEMVVSDKEKEKKEEKE